MTRREHVHDELSQNEKRKVLKDTLHGRAIGEEGTIGGRYGAITKTHVVGSKPLVEYPAAAPWTHDPVPPRNRSALTSICWRRAKGANDGQRAKVTNSRAAAADISRGGS